MNLIDPIHQHAQSRANEAAVITPQGNISWAQLDKLIWSTSVTLAEKGLEAGDRVGIIMVHPVMHLIASLALARLGVANVAIPITESDLIRNELAHKLELKLIITDVKKLISATTNSFLLEKLVVTDVSPEQKQKLASKNSDLAWLLVNSSGTTGNKKFAELSHKLAQSRLVRLDSILGFQKSDIFWSGTAQDFAGGKQIITFCLICGVAICFPIGFSDLNKIIQFLKISGVTIGGATPSKIAALLDTDETLPRFRAFFTGSTFVSERLRKRFEDKTECFLTVVYGTNEVSWFTRTSSNQIGKFESSNVGKPVDDQVKIEIVDKFGNILALGQTGEIRLKVPGCIDNYLNDPDASSKSFKDGWFYPGDLGYKTEDGALILQGRKDDMMIYDGINIYPVEIENVLAAHPAINEVAAFSLKHDQFQDIPVAAVTLKETISEKNLIQYCKDFLGIKHPKRIFMINEFPRNKMGKILKRELPLIVRGEGSRLGFI